MFVLLVNDCDGDSQKPHAVYGPFPKPNPDNISASFVRNGWNYDASEKCWEKGDGGSKTKTAMFFPVGKVKSLFRK